MAEKKKKAAKKKKLKSVFDIKKKSVKVSGGGGKHDITVRMKGTFNDLLAATVAKKKKS